MSINWDDNTRTGLMVLLNALFPFLVAIHAIVLDATQWGLLQVLLTAAVAFAFRLFKKGQAQG